MGALRESFYDRVIFPHVRNRLLAAAFGQVDRAKFAPPEVYFARVYSNDIIGVCDNTTVSEPQLIAEMVDYLGLSGKEKVLEVGTGLGYQAAIMSLGARKVFTFESNPRIAPLAAENLKDYQNVKVVCGDGLLGLEVEAPFDAIIIACAVKSAPATLLEQLAIGGRMVAPVGTDCDNLMLTVYERRPQGFISKALHPVTFVPAISASLSGWSREEIGQEEASREAMLAQTESMAFYPASGAVEGVVQLEAD